MIIGTWSTALSFIALLISTSAYFLYYKRKEKEILNIAHTTFYIGSALIFFQAALLMWALLTHQFEMVYVFSYSSRDLPLYYLISTFWAGQEGTFVLWLVLGAIYSIVIIRNKDEDEPLVMTFMNLIQAFILLILIKKNPFTYVWDVNPHAFGAGQIPADGNGLNPLLQDPWMTIHPPVLFAGYASTAILFAYAVAALIKGEYDFWVKRVYNYTLFVGLSLGAGIILGGYWAYTTLGWGGFWAWDPVENSSLIPWIISLALIHGFIIQRKQSSMKKSNIFMAIITFVLVLYGTFLTRSGVLTDFSVHSFGSSELNHYLVSFILLFLAIGLFFFFYRANEIQGEKVHSYFFSKESFLLFGVLILVILAVITFIGTSSPIITGFLGESSNVSIDYYNNMGKPIAVAMTLIMALIPMMKWKTKGVHFVGKVIIYLVLSVVGTIAAYFLGAVDIWALLIICVSIFAILTNGDYLVQKFQRNKTSIGGYLTHVGAAIMLIGIVASSMYDTSQKVTLPLGEAKIVLEQKLQYMGKRPSPDGKDKVIVNINGVETEAKFYWSDYSRAYMVAPSVVNTALKDLYVSPIQIIPADELAEQTGTSVVLKKNTTSTIDSFEVTFTGYDMGQHAMGSGEVYIAAILKVTNTNTGVADTVKPAVEMAGQNKKNIPDIFPASNREVYLQGINVENGTIKITLSGGEGGSAPSKELLAVEVSIKPLINLVWIGTILLLLGFVFAGIHNYKKNLKS
jgi:cytochrome c-type biogenesis protein CcmF